MLAAERANGLAAIGFTYGYGGDGELAGADAIAERPDQWPELVSQLLARSRPAARGSG